MRTSRRYLPVTIVAFLASTLVACGDGDANDAPEEGSGSEAAEEESSADAEHVLRYAFYGPEASFPSLYMQEWADRVSEETDGRVEFELFPGETLLGAGEIFDGVRQSVADIGLGSPHIDVGRFPASAALTLPLGFADAASASEAYLAIIDEFSPPELEGMVVLGAFTTESSFVQTTSEAATLDELAGRELRAGGALVPQLEALGMVPVGMPMPGVAESLQTGVIEGYASSRDVLRDFGLADFVDTVIDYPIGIAGTFLAVMDEGRFEQLPDDVQTVMLDLRDEISLFAAELHDQQVADEVVPYAEGEGVETVTLDEEEAARWDDALAPVRDAWVSSHEGGPFDAQAVLDRLLELESGA